VPLDTALTVRPLSIVPNGEEFLVGDPARQAYVLLPEVGLHVIQLLQAGQTVATTAEILGVDVDVPDFVATLIGLDFISTEPAAQALEAARPPTLRLLSLRMLRPFFGPIAWGGYAGSALLAIAILALRPSLVPRPNDVFFLPSPLASVTCLTLLSYLLGLMHEACHWAAARAEGLDVRIMIGRRLYFFVFEADLSQLWSLPARRRYSSLLAGMALDAVVTCSTLVAHAGADSGWWHLASGATSFLSMLALIELSGIAAQCYVFMRTDLYAVLVTATGCVNLWRINQLRLLAMVRPLSPEQRRELDQAQPRDLVVARWYAWIYVTGMALALAFFLAYFLPALLHLSVWLVGTLGSRRVWSASFWEALLFTIVVLSPHLLTAAVALHDLAPRCAHLRAVFLGSTEVKHHL
jgi:hypothetical protein